MDTLIGGFIALSSVIKAESREIKSIILDTERKNRICSSSYHFPEKKQYAFIEEYIRASGVECACSDGASFADKTREEAYGGIAAYVGERKTKAISDILEKGNGFYLLIEGIEDPFNFGYVLRTAYACGVGGVLLPERNYFSSSDIVIRSSAGASELLDIAYYKSDDEVASVLKAYGVTIACTAKEKSKKGLPPNEIKTRPPLCVVIGGERRGISKTLAVNADFIVTIDYKRSYAMSLSASQAASIIIYETAKNIFT
ncbi:MAG: RNA methyltransferase [Eubacteriales bacterium]|nr:RNA methyltransferase [Eubacteriales bacterium]